ncbi:hypothetical protein V6N12_053208 [Hibiscus sabdariffa]|uniref:Trichome birefringence-like C-terminal domain-containing protein n=1 Tax=Hibiscus sabdariffa TaxID=183260 RepID=A0ABR2D7R1_9ROSI
MKPPLPSSSSSVLRKPRLSPYLFTLLIFIVFVAILYGEDHFIDSLNQYPTPGELTQSLPFAIGKSEEKCDIYIPRENMGDPTQSIKNGDGNPMHGCDLPSSNATLMLETLKGKRMMFVGDSLNRGQYVSIICLVHNLIPKPAKSMKSSNNDALTVFRAKDYNASIEFCWAPFLLESNSDNAVVHRISDWIVRKGSINQHGKHWKGVDILVFNWIGYEDVAL